MLSNLSSVSQADSMVVLSSWTATNWYSAVNSKDTIRYRPWHAVFYYFTALFNTWVADSHQHAWPHDEKEWFYIWYEDTDFWAWFIKEWSETFTTQSNFNKDKLDWTWPSWFIIDPTKINIFAVQFWWLWSAPALYYVYTWQGRGWVNFHTIEFHNNQTSPSITTPVLPIRYDIQKTAWATDVVMKWASWNAAHVWWALKVWERFFASSNSKTVSTLTNLFTLRSKDTYQSKTNRVSSLVQFLSANSEWNKPVIVRVVKNATLWWTPSYSDIDLENSTMEVDTAWTTVTWWSEELVIGLGKSDSQSIVDWVLGIKMRPWDILTFAAESASTNDVTIWARWKEEC